MHPSDRDHSAPPAQADRNLTYRAAGVDIEAGDDLVERIKPLAKATTQPGVMGGLGGFGALFDLKAAGFKDPILVSTTDGVGTKLKLAIDTDNHDTIGIDLVAMCVNDLVVQGAQPLFFLDYFATGRLDVGRAQRIIAGIAKGCAEADCALVGGETAEMPGMYASGDYDLAGFSVGAVERGATLPRDVTPGDTVLGLASSGIHSNGYSLVRRIIAEGNRNWSDMLPQFGGRTLGDVLLTPTRIYVRSLLALHRQGLLKGAAHITGGGLVGNLPRVLPPGTRAELHATWDVPAVFSFLASEGQVRATEMLRVFNCGIGMAVIVSDPDRATEVLRQTGETVFRIGRIAASDTAPDVLIQDADRLFAA